MRRVGIIVLALLVAPSAFSADLITEIIQVPETLFASVSAVTQRFGSPRSTRISAVPNTHEPAIPNVEATLRYVGMEVTFLIAVCCEKTILQDLSITDSEYLKALGIRVPASRADAVAELGKPTRTTAHELSFVRENDVGADEVVLRYRNGKLAAIAWKYFID